MAIYRQLTKSRFSPSPAASAIGNASERPSAFSSGAPQKNSLASSGNEFYVKQIVGADRTWEFDTGQIAALRFRPEHVGGSRYRESRIELDYGAKTYNFAAGIQPAEASQLLGLVAKWAPTVRVEKAVDS